jgi:hypothetical protein
VGVKVKSEAKEETKAELKLQILIARIKIIYQIRTMLL